MTVNLRQLGITGVQAESILRHEYKIQCELSDAYNLLFIISYADTAEQTEILLQALTGLAGRFKGRPKMTLPVRVPPVPQLGMSPREAFFAPGEIIPFSQAEGRIAAEQIMFYPPGVPLLAPGDVIDKAALDYISTMQQLGLKVVGPADSTLQTIKVVRDDR